MAWLQKAYDTRDSQLAYLKNEQIFDRLRFAPRLQQLMGKIGVPQ